jgi:uncharacterized membrane protein
MSKIKTINLAKVERALSYVLLIGVVVASLLIIFGLVIAFIHTKSTLSANYKVKTSRTYHFGHNPKEIISNILAFNGVGFIEVGLYVLILTPVLRVFSCVVTFIYAKNIYFVLITAFVLIVLVASLIGL